MSRLIVSVLTSLDGYDEGPGHDLSVVPFEDAFNDHNLELLPGAGTLVYGSGWFQNNWDSWSAVAADDSASERDREIARLVTTLNALVISDSLTFDADAPWAETTQFLRREQATAEIANRKAAGGGDLVMFGSGTTWNSLLERGLVDELIVLLGAGLAGGGTPLYRGSPQLGLTLVDAQTLPGSQLVRLRYKTFPVGDANAPGSAQTQHVTRLNRTLHLDVVEVEDPGGEGAEPRADGDYRVAGSDGVARGDAVDQLDRAFGEFT